MTSFRGHPIAVAFRGVARSVCEGARVRIGGFAKAATSVCARLAPAMEAAGQALLQNLVRLAARRLVGRPEHHPGPQHPPSARGGMSEAQLADLKAAIAGKITWAQYFAMWGPGG